MDNTQRIGIIGAGPAGMIAALEAAKQCGQVFLLDKNTRPGRKLRVTGSGRGNLTNSSVSALRYSCEPRSFVAESLGIFDQKGLVDYLGEMGIFTYSTDDGWFYPISNSAANVVDIFEAHLQAAGVNLVMSANVLDILVNGNQYVVEMIEGEKISFDKIIVACGGKAHPHLGSSGELFPILQHLGITVSEALPALSPLLTEKRLIHKLQGLRLDASVSLCKKNDEIGAATGNIIFTEWGINGPGVMDISHLVSKNAGEELTLVINLIPGLESELNLLLQKHRNSVLPLSILLESVLPPKAVQFFLNLSQVSPTAWIGKISEVTLQDLVAEIQRFRVAVKGVRDFDQCQVSSGGVVLKEVNPSRMESRVRKGLFFAGEVLDVIGPCGGYNLQWAFTSGFIAGNAAANPAFSL